MNIAVKLAVRNLLRNRWRSGLTMAGVATAVGLLVWTLAFYDGWIAEMVRGATAVETSQIQVQTVGWAENPRVYRAFPIDDQMIDDIRSVPDVQAISPRVEVHGLIGNEERSGVARIIGVNPVWESQTTPIPEAVIEGRFLADRPRPALEPREVALGRDLARNLRVGLGEELVVFFEAADGSLGNDLLEVVGIIRTGNLAVDQMAAFVHLEDAQVVAALGGSVHTVLIRTGDLERARTTAAEVASVLGVEVGAPEEFEGVPEDDIVVRPWQELAPSLDQMIALVDRSNWVVYLIVYLVAAIGILNAQRMSALERRREFGVMLALGVRPRRMFRILLVETVVLGTVGALVGAGLGLLLSWYYAVAGFNMAIFSDEVTISYMGVAFGDRLYFELSLKAALQPLLVMLGVALLSGLWPAATAAGIEPAPTIAGRT